MVTGDDKAAKEARDLLGDDIVTVQVKEGLGREGALMHSPKKARAMIRAGAEEAMKKISTVKPYKQEFPAKIRWQFLSSDVIRRYQGAAWRIDDRTLEKIVYKPEDIVGP
jgi:D-amino peptidase